MIADFTLRFANSIYVYVLIPVVLGALLARLYLVKQPIYRYTLSNTLALHGLRSSNLYKYVLNALRCIALAMLALLIGKPQLVDVQSQINAEGIDIALVLDLSGSMQYPDFDNNRTRFDVEKSEAIRFINKRENDAIGLIIFAQDAMSRAPLTLDKKLLVDIVNELKIGIINPDGTKLSTAIVTAANRLKHSKGTSKIMIVLTDGEPSEDDLDPSVALEVAKKFGIKIYTVGIGSKDTKLVRDFWGNIHKIGVNKELLQKLARETGGQFFMASDTQDMRSIYDTIDQLEKNEFEMPIFTRYYDIFIPFVAIVLGLILLELLLSTWVWFSL
jgi:Ca-activated chloride channel family protein